LQTTLKSLEFVSTSLSFPESSEELKSYRKEDELLFAFTDRLVELDNLVYIGHRVTHECKQQLLIDCANMESAIVGNFVSHSYIQQVDEKYDKYFFRVARP
jgi:hypothetical protein